MKHQVNQPPEGLSVDPRWPRAGQWLSDGPGDRPPRLVVLGVPAHRTSLTPTGANATPAAVRAALWRMGTWAPSRAFDVSELAVADWGDLRDPDADEPRTSAVVAEAAASNSPVVFALGGDNSITFAVARGVFGSVMDQAGLVTLDAHHDVRDGTSNGSPVRRLIEAGLEPSRVVQIGIADFANSREYAQRVSEWGVHVRDVAEVRRRGIAEVMMESLEIASGGSQGGVHVDLDLDVCDRSVAPGCPASLPGGLLAHELLEAAYLAGSHSQVVSMDVTEVDAIADTTDGRTVRLAAQCLLHAAAGVGRRTR